MPVLDVEKLKRTVSDVFTAASRTPAILEGTYALELAQGCRDLIVRLEKVQTLGAEINTEIGEIGKMANLLYGSLQRMKRLAEVATKAIGD